MEYLETLEALVLYGIQALVWPPSHVSMSALSAEYSVRNNVADKDLEN